MKRQHHSVMSQTGASASSSKRLTNSHQGKGRIVGTFRHGTKNKFKGRVRKPVHKAS